MSGMNTTIIVACNSNRVIGTLDNKIPWRIKEDINLFKEITTGHPVIMGRLTWESIPVNYRPLSDRINIVLTNNPSKFECPKGVFVHSDLQSAIKYVRKCGSDKEIFIIGGGQVYKNALDNNLVDRILVSEVKGFDEIKEGILFPDLNEYGWKRKIISEFDQFTLVEYKQILTSDKISEITMDISLFFKEIGLGNICDNKNKMNLLHSKLKDFFSNSSLSHEIGSDKIDWEKIKEKRKILTD